MKNRSVLVLLVIVVVGMLSAQAVMAQSTLREYIVFSRSETSVASNLRAQIAAAGGTVVRDLSGAGLLVVSSANPNFKTLVPVASAVIPNIRINWLEPDNVVSMDVSNNVANPPTTGDDDFYLDLQWGHDAVNAFEAWEDSLPGRGAGVRVAVLDEGIDRDQPDLAPNLNQALSKSFVPGEDPFAQPGLFFNHGTHVAGTIAAADNAFGVVGVAPEAELVSVKVLSEFTGSGEFEWVLAGMLYAADIRADVINMSLGGLLDSRGECDAPDNCYTAEDVVNYQRAFDRATRYANRRGTTVIASAGNSAIDFDAWENRYLVDLPASARGVIAISSFAPENWATDPENAVFELPASYTNAGREFVDFGAPGGDFDYPGNENCSLTILGAPFVRPCWVFDGVFSTGTSDGGISRYYWSTGTSMAAPHASGVAAIIIGWNGGSMAPDLVYAELRRLSNNVGPETTTYYGHGTVSAAWIDG